MPDLGNCQQRGSLPRYPDLTPELTPEPPGLSLQSSRLVEQLLQINHSLGIEHAHFCPPVTAVLTGLSHVG